jgi:GTP1/Obg family GTP-binding protein
MWTISNEQMKNISNSMRSEFERRAYYVLSKEDSTNEMEVEKIKHNIHEQMDKVIRYKIKDENLAIQFIRLSFEHPALQTEKWEESLENELLESENESEKIEILTNYLI